MKLNIAAIVSPPVMGYMENILPELRSYCDLTLLEAGNNREARAQFEAHGRQYDAVVFSGRIYMVYATRNSFDAGVPCYCFEHMDYDLTPLLYGLLLRNRDFDFSRISIDLLLSRNEASHGTFFPVDQMPYCADETFEPLLSIDDVNGALLTQKTLDWHVGLNRAGKTDLAVTCHGAITKELEAAGVPYVYVLPSREYVVNFFLQIISGMTMKLAENQLIGTIVLRCQTCGESDSLLARCGEAIASFARLNGYDFSFARHAGRLELFTRYKELSEVTHNFEAAPFASLMEPEDRARLTVGLGSGNTLFQARLNAEGAVYVAGTTNKVYYISYEGKLTGPLGAPCAEYDLQPAEELLELSRQCGVDHLALQQMRSFARMAGRKDVTAQELAQFMNVSRRTANRLLGKLVSNGGAEVYAENPTGGKGRPTNRYLLLFV